MQEQPEDLTSEASVQDTEPVRESIVTVEAPPSGEMLIPAPLTDGDTWTKISLKPRVDSFNEDELLAEIKSLVDAGVGRIALDLTQNRFLSVRAIKACVDAAEKIVEMDGVFAIIACIERTKRHFEVYGSTDHVRFVRTERDLQAFKSRKTRFS